MPDRSAIRRRPSQAARDAALLGLIALAARLFRADAQSLWYDEGTSAALATRGAREILAAAAADIHPPLYYLLLAGWSRALGDGVWALRGLSALLGAIGVVGTYVLVRRLAGRLPALTAGLLAAFAPFLVWYGQEVRMYVLAAAIAPWLAWTALRVAGGEQRDRAPARRALLAGGAAALTTAALYTHYLAGASIVVAANAVALGAQGARWRSVRRASQMERLPADRASTGYGFDALPAIARDGAAWAAAQLVAALLFAPWLAHVWSAVAGWPALGGPVSAAFVARESLTTYALGVRAPSSLAGFWPLVALVAALGAAVGLARKRWRGAALVGLALAVVPPASVWAASLRKPAWQPKFLTSGAVGFELLLALGVLAPLVVARRWGARAGRAALAPDHIGNPLSSGRGARPCALFACEPEEGARPCAPTSTVCGRILAAEADIDGSRDARPPALRAAAILALLSLALAPRLAVLRANLYDPAHQRDDYRGIAAAIAGAAGPDDAVVLTAPTQVEVFGYYDRGRHATHPLPASRPPDRAATEARLAAIGTAHRDLFGVLWATGEADPDGIVEGWLNTNRHKAYDRWFGDVRLALWAAERTPASPLDGVPARFGDDLELRRLHHGPLEAAPGDVLTLTAAWALVDDGEATDATQAIEATAGGTAIGHATAGASAPGRPDVTVFVHLLAGDGSVAAQRDMRPVGGSAATSAWPAGHAIVDRIALALPDDLVPGAYRLVLGLYDPASGARLAITGGRDLPVEHDALVVGTVVVR